jgi:hypothetical protein
MMMTYRFVILDPTLQSWKGGRTSEGLVERLGCTFHTDQTSQKREPKRLESHHS